MAIPTSLFLLTCVGCQPSTTPAQLPAETPQVDAPISIFDVSPLQLAQAEEANAAAPDGAIAVEWSARSRESDPATPLKLGSQGAGVMRLQTRLARLGYAVTMVDGKFGPQTQAAVQQFQQANGLIAGGVVDAITWAKLNLEITQSGQVPLSKVPQQPVIQPELSVSPLPPEPLPAANLTLAATAPSHLPFSQKNGWIAVLVILQGAGWLVILQGLDKELVLLTGRSLFPSKNKQWLFSFKQ